MMSLYRPRLRLPIGVVPWNPNDDEIEIDPMLRPRPVLVPPAAAVSTVIPSPAIGPPPIAVNRSRPQRIPTLPGEELAAEQQYGQAVDAFRPQPRGWKSRLAFAGLNALGGLGQGGIGGAIGGGLASLGIAAVDPTVPDKFWKYRTQAESEGRLQRLRGQRRGDLQDRLLESQVIENEAQAEASRRPRPPKLVETVLADGTTVLTPESEGIVTARPKPAPPLIEMQLSDGRKVLVPPSTAVTADATRENRREREEAKTTERETKQTEALTKREAKLREADELVSNAAIYDNNAVEDEKEARRYSDPNNYDELASRDAAARARENRQQANLLRRQAATARTEAATIPAAVKRPRVNTSRRRAVVIPKSDPLGLYK
jgi:hypothetical protein